MRKSDSSPVKETPEQELKRLRKENAKLKRQLVKQKDEDKAKLKSLSSLFPDIDTLFR